MNPRLKASRAAIELIKRFEGFRRASAQLADGRWTIGYGHTKTARQGVEISEADAEALLVYDLIDVQAAVNDATFTALNQNQFDALTAFAFNLGVDNFQRSSALRRVNEGNLLQAACAIEMWRKADLNGERIVVDALVRRRAAEKALFLTPIGDQAAAPSSIVRPRVDYDVAVALPRTSAEVTVALTGERGVALRTDSKGGEPAPATTAAADAVIERLKALNLAEADAGIDLEPPAPAPLEDTDPPDLFEPAPAPAEAAIELEPEPLPAPPAPIEDEDAARRIVRREAPRHVDVDPFIEGKDQLGGGALALLGFLGLLMFGGAVFWGVSARSTGGPVEPMVVATILGLIGIGLVAGTVYVLLVKLSDRGD